MNKRTKAVFWAALALMLLLMSPGFILRFTNENNNKSVITAADYNEFLKASQKAHISFDELMGEFKQNGVKILAVKEVTLEELIFNGKIFVSTVGEYLSTAQAFTPEQAEKTREIRNSIGMEPAGHLIISRDKETTGFLRERLGRRFDKSQLEMFETDGQAFFHVKAELDWQLKEGLGFDEQVLVKIKDKGFDIILRPKDSYGDNTEFIDEYTEIIKKFNVKYLIFDGVSVPGYPDNLSVMEQVVKDNDLLFGIIESPDQIRYIEQSGINDLISNTGYSINRVYSAPESYLLRLNSEELFYQWIRGVIDRNIRIVYVNPLKVKNLSYRENINDTLYAIKIFNQFISNRGYYIDKPLQRLSSRFPSTLHYFIVSMSLVLAGILYLTYLFDSRLKLKAAVLLFVIGIAGSLALIFVMPFKPPKPLALAAAILYPTFSTLMVLRFIRHNTEKSLVVQVMSSLGLLIGINAIGMYSVVSTLSDIRFIMNVDIFKGVKISLIMPLMLFFVNYVFCFAGYDRILSYLSRISRIYMTYLAAAIIGIGGMAFYLYVARSGNDMGATVPDFELRIREIFEKTLLARPRLKEFGIGYPALFLLIYFYKRFRKDVFPFVFGAAVVIGSVSMVNSFCHVFTAISISALRTLYGLILGVITGVGAVIAFVLIEKAALWLKKTQVE